MAVYQRVISPESQGFSHPFPTRRNRRPCVAACTGTCPGTSSYAKRQLGLSSLDQPKGMGFFTCPEWERDGDIWSWDVMAMTHLFDHCTWRLKSPIQSGEFFVSLLAVLGSQCWSWDEDMICYPFQQLAVAQTLDWMIHQWELWKFIHDTICLNVIK